VGQYQYDALGRRVQKIASPTGAPLTTLYFYDDARVIEEQNLVATQATYVYGNYIDEILTMVRSGQTYYYHQNALWSVEAITDSSGTPVERYAYDAYGLVTVTSGTGTATAPNAWGTPHSAIGNSWMFTGRQVDEETGLYYYRARYYDPAKGRFLQRDPMEYVDGMNLYEYVRSNPLKVSDSLGLKKCCVDTFTVAFVDRWDWRTIRGRQTISFRFNIDATFKDAFPCCPECCQYRQLIRGYIKQNGALHNRDLQLGTEATDVLTSSFREDGDHGVRPGHDDNEKDDSGIPVRSDDLDNSYPSAGRYHGSDRPGVENWTGELDFIYYFAGKIVDVCNAQDQKLPVENQKAVGKELQWSLGALIVSKTSFAIGFVYPH